jgi:hypothetical protein
MILASAVDTYGTIRALSLSEAAIGHLVWTQWKAIFLPAVIGAVFLIRAYILLSSSRRPYYQIVASGVLAILVTLGYYGIWIWVEWQETQSSTNCIPVEGKICFAIYSNPAWYWSNLTTFFYPILAMLRTATTAAWAAMKYQYK